MTNFRLLHCYESGFGHQKNFQFVPSGMAIRKALQFGRLLVSNDRSNCFASDAENPGFLADYPRWSAIQSARL